MIKEKENEKKNNKDEIDNEEIVKTTEENTQENNSEKIDEEQQNFDNTEENLYGESTTKYYDKGFRVNCLIQFDEPEVNLDEFGTDVNATIEMYFHRTTLVEANFYPEVGDIVDWNDNYWEINGTTEPQLFAGHPNFKHNIVATAHRSRLSSLQIEERPR